MQRADSGNFGLFSAKKSGQGGSTPKLHTKNRVEPGREDGNFFWLSRLIRADRLGTASYTRDFVTESLVLGKVREQFADLEQSSLRNDNFLGARSLVKFRVFEENSPFVD